MITISAPIQQNLFGYDYELLPEGSRGAVMSAAEEIKTLAKRSVYDVIRIGEQIGRAHV